MAKVYITTRAHYWKRTLIQALTENGHQIASSCSEADAVVVSRPDPQEWKDVPQNYHQRVIIAPILIFYSEADRRETERKINEEAKRHNLNIIFWAAGNDWPQKLSEIVVSLASQK